MTVIQSILCGLLIVVGFSLLLPETRSLLAGVWGQIKSWFNAPATREDWDSAGVRFDQVDDPSAIIVTPAGPKTFRAEDDIALRPDLLDTAKAMRPHPAYTSMMPRPDLLDTSLTKMSDEQLRALKPSAISGASEAHDLYKDGDDNPPPVICDSNGSVTLGLCKRCGKGEAELWNDDGSVSECLRPDNLNDDIPESSKVPATIAALNDWIAANFEVRRGYATRTWHYAPKWTEGVAPPALQEREFHVLSMDTPASEKAEADLVYAMWGDLVTLKLNMLEEKPIMAVRTGLLMGDHTEDFGGTVERLTSLYFRFDLPQVPDYAWGLAKCLTREGEPRRRVPVVATSGYAQTVLQDSATLNSRNAFEGLGQVLFSDDVAKQQWTGSQMPAYDTANVVQADLWLQWRDAQIKLVEELRREKFDPTLNPRPIANVVDYAAAAQAIELAMQALDEALPNGQRVRVEQAMKLATEGLKHLRAWCAVRGYTV